MKKDWSGNKASPFVTNGCTNHSEQERSEYDYYATDPKAVVELLKKESFIHPIWENACGECHISKALKMYGYNVFSSDVVKRRSVYQDSVIDFLKYKGDPIIADIVTNPPYKYALNFVEHSLDLIQDGCKVAMFLKLTFLEGEKRRKLFEKYPPKKIYVFSKRINCAMNGNEKCFYEPSAVCYAWFIWEKGSKSLPVVDWI